MPFDNIYRLDRQGRKGQSCRILACGTMNTCLVEFADGIRMVTTDSALGKKASREWLKHLPGKQDGGEHHRHSRDRLRATDPGNWKHAGLSYVFS